jgi:hypothetical protein
MIFALVTNLVKVLLLFEWLISPGWGVHPIVVLWVFVLNHSFTSFLRLQILSLWPSCRIYFGVKLSGIRRLGSWSAHITHIIIKSLCLKTIWSNFLSVAEIVPCFAELLNPFKFCTSATSHEFIKFLLCLHLEHSLLLNTFQQCLFFALHLNHSLIIFSNFLFRSFHPLKVNIPLSFLLSYT